MTGTYPEKRRIGYARVLTYGQTLDSQLEQLRKAGCATLEELARSYNVSRVTISRLTMSYQGGIE